MALILLFPLRLDDDRKATKIKIREAWGQDNAACRESAMNQLDSDSSGNSKQINIPIVVENENPENRASRISRMISAVEPKTHLIKPKKLNSCDSILDFYNFKSSDLGEKEKWIDIPVNVISGFNLSDQSGGGIKRYLK